MNKSGGISVGIPTSGGFGLSAPDALAKVPDVKAPKVKGNASMRGGLGDSIGFSAPECSIEVPDMKGSSGMKGGIGFSAPVGSIEVPDMKGEAGIEGGISVSEGSIEVPDIPDMEVPTFDAVSLLNVID